LLFIETSAKTSQEVEHAFLETAQQIYNKVEKGEIDISSEVVPNNEGLRREARKHKLQPKRPKRTELEEEGRYQNRKERLRVLLINIISMDAYFQIGLKQ
jgi:hypothetical protein